MRRDMLSLGCVICGVLMIVFGLSGGISPEVASAMPMLQPSPRPTLAPQEDSDWKPTPVIATSRVTGTIIDLTTGAPIPGVAVDVGGVIVTSDSNGNYERTAMVSGHYTVTLQLAPGVGISAQPTQNIAVGQGDSVTVHLFFYSQSPTAVPTTPPPPVATPVAAGGAAVPPKLPVTSVETKPAQRPASAAETKPARLPVTATNSIGSPWLWLVLGAFFVTIGGALQFLPRSRRVVGRSRKAGSGVANPADSASLLAALLASDVPQPANLTRDDTKMLEAMLTDDVL